MSRVAIRAKKPLNPESSAAADDEIYRLHANDDTPGPLFDEQGNRRPLSGTDPDQEALRQEWIALYGKNGGAIERRPQNSQPPDKVVKPCPLADQKGVAACKELLEKLKKEAADVADDNGDPQKNGSEVNRRITSSYAQMYTRRPDLYWVGAATCVSKQMGCNMRLADDKASASKALQFFGKKDDHDVRALGASTKKVLVRGNQAIFKDIYPQYRLYETSPECITSHGEALGLNPKMVAGFKDYAKGDQYKALMKHADYEQNVNLQNEVMENSALSKDVANFQEAQDANQERKARWFGQSQPEQVSFSRECVAADDTYYYKTPASKFTERDSRWNAAVSVLDKYDELMREHPEEMKETIGSIGKDMNAGDLPSYDSSWYQMR